MGNKQKVVTVAEATRELDGIRKAATMAGRAIARLEATRRKFTLRRPTSAASRLCPARTAFRR